jgi:integrase
MMMGQARMRVEGCPFVFHRDGVRIQSFAKAWNTACKKAGYSGKLVHDLRRTGVRNLIRAGVPQSVAMKISGHKDARIFALCFAKIPSARKSCLFSRFPSDFEP